MGLGRLFAAASLYGGIGRRVPGVPPMYSTSRVFSRPFVLSFMPFLVLGKCRNFLQRSFHLKDFVDVDSRSSWEDGSVDFGRGMIEWILEFESHLTPVRVDDPSCDIAGSLWSSTRSMQGQRRGQRRGGV